MTSRGFHRIGIAIAAIPFAVGVFLLIAEASWQAKTVGLGASQPQGFQNLYNIPNAPHYADYAEGIGALCLALALYVAARAIGWVFDGFASTSRAEASE